MKTKKKEEPSELTTDNKDPFDVTNLKGVGPVTAKKLAEEGIGSLFDLVTKSGRAIAEITGLDKEDADNMLRKARTFLEEGNHLAKSIVSGYQAMTERLEVKRISTGSKDLDSWLGGGIETGAVTEVYGEFGSGKTQLGHTLSVNVQMLEEQGGLGGNVFYIDTENTFRPERIVTISKLKGLEPNQVLKNITKARAHDAGQQILMLKHASTIIQRDNIKLIVIDSIIGNFRPDYAGRGNLADRQQDLNAHIQQLKRICETFNIAGVVTNQVMISPNQAFGDPNKPVGGSVVAHASTYRIYFRKSGKKRVAKMIDSPNQAETECIFMLGEAGIIDVIEEKKE